MDNRLEYPVSYFKNLYEVDNPDLKCIDDIFKIINDYGKFDQSLRESRISNKQLYDQNKKKLPCFVFGKFKERSDKSCLEYNPCICIDIDKVKDSGELEHIHKSVQTLDYVFSSFYSISGLGLRVLIWTEATLESHGHYYIKTMTKLEDDLKKMGIECCYDNSTTNVSRAWYITPLKGKEEFYINPTSKVLSFSHHHEAPSKQNQSLKNEGEALALCIEIIGNRNIDGRNNTVMQLTRLASEYGVSQDAIINHCNSMVDESSSDPFTYKEMIKTVESNMRTLHRSIGQLRNYHKSVITEQGKEKGKFHEIVEFVENKFDLRFNEFSKEHEFKLKHETAYRPTNIEAIEYELFNANMKGFKDMLRSIVMSNKVGENFNPLQSYLDNLPIWDDSQTDHIEYLSTFIETDDQDFWRVQFKKMIIRCLACSLNMIPFNKQVLCLLSEDQDLGKTSFLRFLCPKELRDYYQEYLPLSDKDSYKALGGNIYINLDEIDEFKTNELNKLKSWISKDKVKLRIAYGKSDIIMPRIANFLATGNNYEMLIDLQNVRWLNFKIKHVRHDEGGENGYNKLVDIDQVYAQAYALLKSGFDYQMTREEKRYMEQRNKKYFSAISVEQQMIQEYFELPVKENDDYINTSFETAASILNILNGHCNNVKLSSINIGRAMNKLGFPKCQKRQGDNQFSVKGYLVKNYK